MSGRNDAHGIIGLAEVEVSGTAEKLQTGITGIGRTDVFDANKELFCKILSGDKSDNIPSVYTVTKNNKTYGITELKAGQITNMFLEKTGTALTPELLYVDSALGTLCECIQKVMKTDTNIDELLQNLKRNIKYIHLSKNNIPKEVVSDMMKSV